MHSSRMHTACPLDTFNGVWGGVRLGRWGCFCIASDVCLTKGSDLSLARGEVLCLARGWDCVPRQGAILHMAIPYPNLTHQGL